jgi:hypothetical protein
MTPEEIRRTYTDLAEIVREVRLDWVVSQVEQAAYERKRDFPQDEEELFPSEDQPPFPRTGTSDRDKLLSLIDGLRHAIVHAAAVESEQIRLLQSFDGVEQVIFDSGEEAAAQRPFQLRGVPYEGLQELQSLLDSLEREVKQ